MKVPLICLVFSAIIINEVYAKVSIQIRGYKPPQLEEVVRYPMTLPTFEYRIGVVCDLGKDSDTPGADSWYSYFKKGKLIYNPNSEEADVDWDSDEEKGELISTENSNNDNRGFELSELFTYDGNLLTGDDQTGTIYSYTKGIFKSWLFVAVNEKGGKGWEKASTVEVDDDGNKSFNQSKAMPIEWATVVDGKLYVGPNGIGENTVVAEINHDRKIKYEDWDENFKKLKAVVGMSEGYMSHESVVYSSLAKKWYFLPKRASTTPYNENNDKNSGVNYLLSIDEKTKEAKKEAEIRHPTVDKSRGYSSFKFVPGTKDSLIVALQTSDITNESFITVFKVTGEVVYNSSKIADVPFEGIEFL